MFQKKVTGILLNENNRLEVFYKGQSFGETHNLDHAADKLKWLADLDTSDGGVPNGIQRSGRRLVLTEGEPDLPSVKSSETLKKEKRLLESDQDTPTARIKK